MEISDKYTFTHTVTNGIDTTGITKTLDMSSVPDGADSINVLLNKFLTFMVGCDQEESIILDQLKAFVKLEKMEDYSTNSAIEEIVTNKEKYDIFIDMISRALKEEQAILDKDTDNTSNSVNVVLHDLFRAYITNNPNKYNLGIDIL